MFKALIVAAPTIDYIYKEGRLVSIAPGGPTLYSGLALLSRFNIKVYSVGPVGYLSLYTARVERMVGIERLGYTYTGPGAVFELDYSGHVRRARALGVLPTIDNNAVLDMASRISPDIALISPIYGEEPGIIHRILYSSYSRCLGIDLQGYARTSNDIALHIINEYYTVLHTSIDDIDFNYIYNIANNKTIIYTRGDGPVSVIDKGTHYIMNVDKNSLLDDSTGAGDVFTALTLAHICEGDDVIESVKKAIIETPQVLRHIRTIVDAHRVSPKYAGNLWKAS